MRVTSRGMGCLFCDIAAKRVPSDTVHEDDELYAFRDIDPKAPIHILLIPKQHIATMNDLTPGQAALIGHLVLKARDLAREEGIAEKGYRLLTNCNAEGGQAVFHLHFHLLGGRKLAWPPG